MANSIEEEDQRISVGEISEASSIENLGWDLYNDNSDETNNESSIMNDDNDNEEPPRISNVSTLSSGEDLGWDLYDGDDDDDEKIREPPTSGGIEVMDDDDDEPRPLCYTHDNDVVETGEGKKKMAGIEVVNDSDDATPTFVASVDVSPGYDITSTFSETSHSKSNETPKDYDEENTIVHANNSSGSNHHLSRKERKAHKDEQEVVAATYSAAVAKRRRTIMLCSIFPLIAAAIALITLSIKDTAESNTNTPEELDTNDAFDRDDLKLGNVIATVKEDTASTHSGPDEHGYLRPTTIPATSATTPTSTITADVARLENAGGVARLEAANGIAITALASRLDEEDDTLNKRIDAADSNIIALASRLNAEDVILHDQIDAADSNITALASRLEAAEATISELTALVRALTQTPTQSPSSPPTVAPVTPPRIVFVTSQEYSGDALGGIAGAHSKCQTLANAAPGLSGRTFKAWLSNSTGYSPAQDFVKSDGPYVNTNGDKVANDWLDLITDDGSGVFLNNSITFDEDGVSRNSLDIWTGTNVTGMPDSNGGGTFCSDWTSTSGYARIGVSSFTDQFWTSYPFKFVPCFASLRLYCFEQ